MGGGSDTEQQHLLVALPFAEPTKVIERIKKNFPRMKVSYVNLNDLPSLWEDVARHVPKGIYQAAPDGNRWSSLIIVLELARAIPGCHSTVHFIRPTRNFERRTQAW